MNTVLLGGKVYIPSIVAIVGMQIGRDNKNHTMIMNERVKLNDEYRFDKVNACTSIKLKYNSYTFSTTKTRLNEIKEDMLLNKYELKEIQKGNISKTEGILYRENNNSFNLIVFDEARKAFININAEIKPIIDEQIFISEISIVTKEAGGVIKLEVYKEETGIKFTLYLTYEKEMNALKILDE